MFKLIYSSSKRRMVYNLNKAKVSRVQRIRKKPVALNFFDLPFFRRLLMELAVKHVSEPPGTECSEDLAFFVNASLYEANNLYRMQKRISSASTESPDPLKKY